MLENNLLLWTGLIVLVVLAVRAGRTVKARDISGIVVMGNVHGDVTQHQETKPAPPSKPSLWKEVLTLTNVLLGIIGAALTIANFII